MDDVQTLRMPLSGLWVQWRPSRRSWRVGKPDELAEYDSNPIYDEGWAECTGLRAINGRAQRSHRQGGNPQSSWWLLHGEVVEEPVSVTLGDGTRVPVQVLGGVWAAEWTSTPQRAVVRRAASESSIPFDRPVHY